MKPHLMVSDPLAGDFWMNPTVQSFIDRFSESSIQNLTGADGFSDYKACLPAYWSGQFEQAVSETSGILSANPDHPLRFALYRLWIDSLVELEDAKSLNALQEHLMLRGASEESDRGIYMAIRGLVHLELDRPHAANLMLKAIADDETNLYGMELATRIQDRLIHTAELPPLLHTERTFSDFVTWQTLVRSFAGMNQRHRAEPCLGLVQRIYPDSPLRDIFYLHWSIDVSDWNSVLEHAEHLVRSFPLSKNFTFQAAHAALRLNRFNQSVSIIENSPALDSQLDADAAMIMGQARKNIGMQKRDIQTLNMALQHLDSASQLFRAAGHSPMPAELLKIQITDTINELMGTDTSTDKDEHDLFRPTQAWLVKLSHRRYLELKNSKESQINQLTRPMGSKARPGDLCFFAVAGAANNQNTWKIAAIYTIESNPVWHPTSGHQSALQLIAMPKRLIPVAVQFASEPDRRKRTRTENRDNAWQHGVFQLEEGVLDLIQEAIRQHQAASQDSNETSNKSRDWRAI